MAPWHVISLVLPSVTANFIGPFGPRTGTATGSAAADPPPAAGTGFTQEDVRALLHQRHALVISGEDVTTAVAVAEALVDVGADVVLGCARPERAARAAQRMTQGASERRAAAVCGADDDGVFWSAGCEVRLLDLSSASSVCGFAEALCSEGRPLHVIVNCAEDFHPIYRRPDDGWELTAGRNHLGPLLLTQLLLDQVVSTMRSDAAQTAAAAKAAVKQAKAASHRGGGRRKGRGAEASTLPQASGSDGGKSSGDQVGVEGGSGGGGRDGDRDGGSGGGRGGGRGGGGDVKPRPYPAPLGRVISLGLEARVTQSAAELPAIQGLYLRRGNYSGWGAYRCAHEANTLAALQLSRMLQVVRTPSGECVEVNLVRPSRGRWLPARLRRWLGTAEATALQASFLASTPLSGMSGLFLDDFQSESAYRTPGSLWRPAPSAAAASARANQAAKSLYRCSMALIGDPAAQWRAEAAMLLRGYTARQRRRAAQLRRPPPPPKGQPAPFGVFGGGGLTGPQTGIAAGAGGAAGGVRELVGG